MNLLFSAKLSAKILLIITDRLSKGVILIPMLSIFTPVEATVFMKYYTPYHGFLKAIINDKRIQFTSAVWVIIYEALEIERRLFWAYHPEIDRATEHANQVI